LGCLCADCTDSYTPEHYVWVVYVPTVQIVIFLNTMFGLSMCSLYR